MRDEKCVLFNLELSESVLMVNAQVMRTLQHLLICFQPHLRSHEAEEQNGEPLHDEFVDHKSNYVKLFLARTKDQAARLFDTFLVFFEKRFKCRIHVLSTDSGW